MNETAANAENTEKVPVFKHFRQVSDTSEVLQQKFFVAPHCFYNNCAQPLKRHFIKTWTLDSLTLNLIKFF